MENKNKMGMQETRIGGTGRKAFQIPRPVSQLPGRGLSLFANAVACQGPFVFRTKMSWLEEKKNISTVVDQIF